ncbi:hypothetical protein ACS0TY_020094 [Phlomoides rotata]
MIALITLSLFFFFSHITHAHIFIYAGCSQQKYPPNSPYEANKNSLLSSIAAASSITLFNAFAVGNDSTAGTAAYGVFQCRGDLKPRDCSTCVADSINQIELLCPDTYGANLQLDGCFLRYEDTDFLGKVESSTLRYKKCSTSRSNDVEFLRRRDEVLSELQGAYGFRVSATGEVEGYAQCLGDLTAADCSGCLSEAVEKVKMLCGTAAAGDVFLTQCYVRYWEAGYYDSSSGSSNQDDVGKTVAIIVGAVAGVAIVIVLLSFCRKAYGK